MLTLRYRHKPILSTLLIVTLSLGYGVIAGAQTVQRGGGTQEGIKVHGHWVIEVRNPDGGLVERREFDNALAPGGPQLLAQWLLRSGSPARWVIELGDYSLPGPGQGGLEQVLGQRPVAGQQVRGPQQPGRPGLHELVEPVRWSQFGWPPSS